MARFGGRAYKILKPGDQGQRHKSVAAVDHSKKHLSIGTKLELDVTKK